MQGIERAGDLRTQYLQQHPPTKKLVRGVGLDSVFRGDLFSPFDTPVALNAEPPVLGDRVVNLTSTGVPFGLKGTVIAIHSNTGYTEV